MKTKTSSLKKKLWKVFTTYIKIRDNWRCVTCGKEVSGYNAQGGHYVAKAACGADYYFSEVNVNCQCASCNLFLEGNRPEYRKYLIRKHGEQVVEDLEKNFRTPNPDYPYEEKIEEYKQKIKEWTT